ncbi:unnamed protein product [marine sediment metagenome]|uniref:B12-binding domain-containing protein n=1 Tax=marine sediment metagenome TaxID=412755 RepID=X1MV06_9ZZZZ
MKILLVNPSQRGVYGKLNAPAYPPLGLSYIGAVLEDANHEVKIIDMDTDKISKEKFLKIIKNYEVIGITATTPVFKEAEKLFKLIKENTNAITILGGVHATIAPKECVKSYFLYGFFLLY